MAAERARTAAPTVMVAAEFGLVPVDGPAEGPPVGAEVGTAQMVAKTLGPLTQVL